MPAHWIFLWLALCVTTVVSRSASSHPPQAKVQPHALEQTHARTDQYGDPLPEGAIARLGTVRWRTGGVIHSLAFSPNGRFLASGSDDGTIRLWDLETGKPRSHVSATPLAPAFAFSPDGRLLAWTDLPGVIRLWDTDRGAEVTQFQSNHGLVAGVAFSPDNRILASTGIDSTVRVWDWTGGQELCHFQGRPCFLTNPVGFSADGKLLAASGLDNTIRVWDLATHKEVQRFENVDGELSLLGFAPDDKTIVSATGGRMSDLRGPEVNVWDVRTGKAVRSMRYLDYSSAAFSPDRQIVVLGTSLGKVFLWNIARGDDVAKLSGDERHIEAVAISPTGKLVATGDDYRTIRLWEIGTLKKPRPVFGPEGECLLAGFTEQGNRIITACRDGVVRFWEPDTGKQTGQRNWNLRGVRAIAMSPDQRLLAWGVENGLFGEIAFAQIGNDTDVHALHGRNRFGLGAEHLAFSPDGKLLAAGQRLGGSVEVWNTVTRKHLYSLDAEAADNIRKWTEGLTFSPDSKCLASVGADLPNVVRSSRFRLWDMANGKEIRSINLRPSAIQSIAFSPDGEFVAYGGYQGSISLLKAASNWSASVLSTGQSPVSALVFSPDGRSLACGRHDGTVCLWEMATRDLRGRWTGHTGAVSRITFSPEGTRLLSGSHDTTAIVWDLTGLMVGGHLPAGRLSEIEIQALWQDLCDPNAAHAAKAVWKLVTAPADSIPFLRKTLQPVTPIDPNTIDRLIAELGDDRFAVRKQAMAELEKASDLAAPVLRRTLENKPEPEVRQRAERLLKRLAPAGSPERLRLLRAVEILEQVGTPAAVEVLKKLVKGVPQARLTQEAKASLERLAKRVAPR
jgi:WD40 repeat protein